MTRGAELRGVFDGVTRDRFGAFVESALILEGLLLLFLSRKHRIMGDGEVRFMSLARLFENGELVNTPYSVIGPIFATPLHLLDRLTGTPDSWLVRYNFFIMLVGVILLYRLLRAHTSGEVVRKFLILLLIGSMFARHLMDFYGEVFTAVLASVGLFSLGGAGGAKGLTASWGWAAVLLAVANTPAALVGLGFASLALAIQHRQWRHLLLPVAATVMILGERWLRRGSPLVSGYEGDAGFATVLPYSGEAGFSYPFILGLISVLFSFGKGLVFFAPGLLLSVKERTKEYGSALWDGYRLWLLFLAGMVVVYAKWWSWYGGWYWGPRFFLFASVPASFALALALVIRKKDVRSNVFLLLVLLLSVYVGINGVIFDQWGLDLCMQNDYALESLCWYVPEFSVLFRPFVQAKPLSSEDYTWLAFGIVSFAWLAGPVLRDIATGSRAWARDVLRGYSGGFRF